VVTFEVTSNVKHLKKLQNKQITGVVRFQLIPQKRPGGQFSKKSLESSRINFRGLFDFYEYNCLYSMRIQISSPVIAKLF
jgi:hypothetical protein